MPTRNIAILALFVAVAAIASALALISVPVAAGVTIAIIVAAAVLLRPFVGLMIYLVLLYLRPQDIFPQLEKLRVVLALAALLILSFFAHKLARRERIRIIETRQHLLIFTLLILVPASNIVNFRLKAAWDGLNQFLTVFLLFYLIASVADDFKKFRAVCWTLVGCTAATCINTLIQKFRGLDLVGQSPILGRVHWIGLFGDPNDYALLVNSMLPFVLLNLFGTGRSRVEKLGLALLGALFISTIYYTNSRGGFVALLLILFVFALRRWGLAKGLILGAIFLAAGLAFSPSRVGEINPYEMSARGRVLAWVAGLVMLKSRPIFGVGFNNFELFHERAAHSAYIQCMAELGLVGYFVWVSLVNACATDLRKSERFIESPFAGYAPIVELSLVGFLGSAAFLSQAYSPVLYIVAALSVLVARGCGATEGRTIIPKPFEALIVAGIMGFSIVLFKLLAIVYGH